jgi:hypothetical protein
MSSVDFDFSCDIDHVSEDEVVNATLDINYSINNFIVNIMADKRSIPTSKPSYSESEKKPTEKDCDKNLLRYLIESRLSDHIAIDFVVEFPLRNLIITLLHTHFFEGDRFFGVGSESLCSHLERMMSELIAGGELFKKYILYFV